MEDTKLIQVLELSLGTVFGGEGGGEGSREREGGGRLVTDRDRKYFEEVVLKYFKCTIYWILGAELEVAGGT